MQTMRHVPMVAQNLLFVMLTLSTVLAEQMQWGDNPDMVEEANDIEGREKDKIMVVIEGEDMDLECQVLSTSDPVSDIRWKIDGKEENTEDQPIISTAFGEVFIESHLQMSNISRDRDGSTVSCNYAKGQYGGSVEALLAVFKMDFCNCGGGNVTIKTNEEERSSLFRILFMEAGRGSPGERNVDKRIKAKITNITFTDEDQITSENGEYSVTVPHNTVYPQLITDRLDTIPQCEGVTTVTTTTMTSITTTPTTKSTTTTTITTTTTTTTTSTTTSTTTHTTTSTTTTTTTTTTTKTSTTPNTTITSTTGNKSTIIPTKTTATAITSRTTSREATKTTARMTTTRTTNFPKHIEATLITAEISISGHTDTIVTRIKLKIEGTTGTYLLVRDIQYLRTCGNWIDLTTISIDGYIIKIHPTIQSLITIKSPGSKKCIRGWEITRTTCKYYSYSYYYNWYPVVVYYRDGNGMGMEWEWK
eukprot:GFUD01002562.1.p1 GENE.GFUD01002562.1~~GFUD01002562.1.p1  ORF type:complete len:476 (+),score=94.20 GFUD01002562.1:97-1524(+)